MRGAPGSLDISLAFLGRLHVVNSYGVRGPDLIKTRQSRHVRPFEVSCCEEDVLQLIADGPLKKDFANSVGLPAHSAVDHTVYLRDTI